MISTPDRMLNNTQSAFVGRKLIRVALNGIHFYPLICPLGALIVPKMGISWSRCPCGRPLPIQARLSRLCGLRPLCGESSSHHRSAA